MLPLRKPRILRTVRKLRQPYRLLSLTPLRRRLKSGLNERGHKQPYHQGRLGVRDPITIDCPNRLNRAVDCYSEHRKEEPSPIL
jgi:hypothetical protein